MQCLAGYSNNECEGYVKLASSEVPMEVLSQLLSCHMSKLGHILKVLADSYRKQCSAVELLKMFLQTAGYRYVEYFLHHMLEVFGWVFISLLVYHY